MVFHKGNMDDTDKKKPMVIVVAGPTGSGKTDLGVVLARHFCSPIVSADSRQVYKGMPIGTAQPSAEQLALIRHYLIASHDIGEPYNAGRYEREALDVLNKIFEEHKTAIVVGGSGLYIDALCDGMDSLPEKDAALREELNKRAAEQGLDGLLEQLKELDPVYYDRVDRNNPNRVIRALEVCLRTGKPYSTQRSGEKAVRNFSVIKIGTLLPREDLYERINRRVDIMIDSGLEDEVRRLYPHRELNSLQTVGYREFFDYFDGITTRDQAIELIKRNSRRYAKRQMTWFSKDASMKWFDPNDSNKIIDYIEQEINKHT